MDHPTEAIDRYIAMWNETDPDRRRQLIAGLWTEDCTHADPMARVEGPDGIDGLVSTVQERFPGHRFRRTSEVDSHNGHVRFSWELKPERGPAPVCGTDFGTMTPDGRLRAITAFFDAEPASRPLG
jgi:hypothetical protein